MSTISPAHAPRSPRPGTVADGRELLRRQLHRHGRRFHGPGLFDEIRGRGRIARLRGLGGFLREAATFGGRDPFGLPFGLPLTPGGLHLRLPVRVLELALARV